MKLKDSIIILSITAALSIIGNLVGYKTSIIEALPGIIILVLISISGIALSKILPSKIPSVAYIVTLSTLLTVPGVPGAEIVSGYVSKVNFLALTTPILAYAGIYTGKNLDALKKTGWRIVVLSIFVMVGTYIGSAVISEVILRMLGQV